MENIWHYIIMAIVFGYAVVTTYQTNVIQKENCKKIDKLLKHFQIQSNNEVIEDELFDRYITDKKKNKAIKRYRELTGCSLAEALQYVNTKYEK